MGEGEDLLRLAAEALMRSIEFALGQLNARKVNGEMKLRWSRSLVRQVEALINVVEAMGRVGVKSELELDLASYLSYVEGKVPRRFVTEEFSGLVRRVRLRASRRRPSNAR